MGGLVKSKARLVSTAELCARLTKGPQSPLWKAPTQRALVETQTTVWVVHGCATADGVHAGKCRRESVHLCSVEDALIRGWHLGALVETPEPKV